MKALEAEANTLKEKAQGLAVKAGQVKNKMMMAYLGGMMGSTLIVIGIGVFVVYKMELIR